MKNIDLIQVSNWKVITNPFNTPVSRRHAVIGYVNGKSRFLNIQEVTGLRAFISDSTGSSQEYILTGKPDTKTTGQSQDELTPLADAWFSIELRKETQELFGDLAEVQPKQLHLAAMG